ncbi:hypothetical protein M0R45_009889 [Rubus argutus]|uniref:alanine--tRNA ligase n=1 Tax=Rubus argutus TaxID=59490 RepID=A0AAW1Y6E7_RUBAR
MTTKLSKSGVIRCGVPVEHIQRMGEEDNFWTSGVTGPCGPCSEIYYDFHPERGYSDADLNDDTRFIEFYNLVFMEFNKKVDGSLEPLKQKNIDTGLGLERMARILQKVSNNCETDLIYPIIEKVSEMAKVSYSQANDQSKLNFKIVGDHLRAIVSLDLKGDCQGNLGGTFLPAIAAKVNEMSTYISPDVKDKVPGILKMRKLMSAKKSGSLTCLSGKDVFRLKDTYGFPLEETREVAKEHGVDIDMNGFDIEMENQRRQSKAAHTTVNLVGCT